MKDEEAEKMLNEVLNSVKECYCADSIKLITDSERIEELKKSIGGIFELKDSKRGTFYVSQFLEKEEICEFCSKPFNSEYHLSDECISGSQEEDILDEIYAE